jgi:hypothetical protein
MCTGVRKPMSPPKLIVFLSALRRLLFYTVDELFCLLHSLRYMMSPPAVNCLSNPSVDGADICNGFQRWAREKLKVRKSRWRAHRINYKCSHGPHTEEFYKVTPVTVAVDVVMLDSAADHRKQSVDPVPATPNTRSKIDYRKGF